MKLKKKTAKPVAPEPLNNYVSAAVLRERCGDSVKNLADCIFEDMSRLFDYVSHPRKDEARAQEAAIALYKVAGVAVGYFDELGHAWPEIFESIACKLASVPGWISCDKNTEKQNDALRKKLNLGRDAELNYSGKQWSRENRETAIAESLYYRVQGYREVWAKRGETRKAIREAQRKYPAAWAKGLPVRVQTKTTAQLEIEAKVAWQSQLYGQTYELAKKLQPLNRRNSALWFKAAWPTFLADYGMDFEGHKYFAHYWKNDTYFEPDEDNLRKKHLRSNARTLIRDAIKKQIKQAFRSLAPKTG